MCDQRAHHTRGLRIHLAAVPLVRLDLFAHPVHPIHRLPSPRMRLGQAALAPAPLDPLEQGQVSFPRQALQLTRSHVQRMTCQEPVPAQPTAHYKVKSEVSLTYVVRHRFVVQTNQQNRQDVMDPATTQQIHLACALGTSDQPATAPLMAPPTLYVCPV